MPTLPLYEKMGLFYLGKELDPASGEATDTAVLYDAKDLTTHAVCLGMTGSGKTGLGICLLEEAVMDGIPSIVIDVKGDLTNLLLTFPALAAKDFEPWVDPAEAAREGITTEALAARTAAVWASGLEKWDQSGERIARLRAASEMTLYSPGGSLARPLSVLSSFGAPPAVVVDDQDLLADRIKTAVSGLLGLLGIEADPLVDREHILLSTIFHAAWTQGLDRDIAGLIRDVQAPPFDRIGAMALEDVYPQKERMALAMRLNNLLAAPGFGAWMEGEPLDIQSLLWTTSGRPRTAILYLAHLNEAERMFMITLLLNEIIAWMRSQAGTGSLRALVYMDEIFGYFPPVANPPTKIPMLTLLKQARAYGLGVILATQNPVDLDYKGLSNAGTWFVGRLQTERDKERLLDGLESLQAGTYSRDDLDRIISGLSKRQFVMQNAHEPGPVVFQTRWAMSYLRGPLTRTQIKELAGKQEPAEPPAPPVTAGRVSPVRTERPASAAVPERPILPSGVTERYAQLDRRVPAGGAVRYAPMLCSRVQLHYVLARASIDDWTKQYWVVPLVEGRPQWDEGRRVLIDDFATGGAVDEAVYGAVGGLSAKDLGQWEKDLKNQLYQTAREEISWVRSMKLYGALGEEEGVFQARLRQTLREERDAAVEKLRDKYAARAVRLEKSLATARERLAREEAQYGNQKVQTAISIGSAVLNAFLGKRSLSKATTAMRGAGRAARERSDVGQAEAKIEDLEAEQQALVESLEEEVAALEAAFIPEEVAIEQVPIAPRKTEIMIDETAILWVPWVEHPDGQVEGGSLWMDGGT